MRRVILVLLLSLVPAVGHAVGAEVLLHAKVDLENKVSLQRGARLFVNYCLSCHSARYMRYNRMADDLGIGPELLKQNMMFTTDKPGNTMTVALRETDAAKWFGVAPPDLSVIARSRGADWLYSFLMSFYEDQNPSRPFGVNNLVFKDTAMPAVLAPLQGVQSLLEGGGGSDGHGAPAGLRDRLELKQPGSLNPAQYRRAVGDLVNFLVYVGEPAQLVRYKVGFWVLLFLAILFGVSFTLYKEYWKDIH